MNPGRIIIGFGLWMILIPGAWTPSSGTGIPVTDTARLNSIAREIRMALKWKMPVNQADSMLEEAMSLIESHKLQPTLMIQWAQAELAFIKKDYGKAYELAATAVKSSQAQIGPQSQVELMMFFSKTCQFTGQFNFALEILEKAIENAGTLKQDQLLPALFLARADVYSLVGNPEQVKESLSLSLEAARKQSDQKGEMIALWRLGKQRLSYNWDYESADSYLRSSLKIAQTLRDTAGMVATLLDLGWNFYLVKKLDSSLVIYKEVVDYATKGKLSYYLANAYGNIGTIYRDLKQFDEARLYWEKGIKEAEPIKDWYTPSWIYGDMSTMFADRGDYKEAYQYQVLHKKFSDQYEQQKNEEGLNMARAKYDADAVKRKVELLSLRLRNQRLLIYGFAGFLALTIIIGLLLLRQSRLNAKRRISEMDQKILEVTQANLRQQMNPHFIFNTLNSIQYYMYKHDKLATNNYLTKFSSLMRKILDNSQYTSIPIRDELDALQLYLELESIRFRDKFDYEITVDEEIDTLMYKIPTMLIQPYVENAICHGLMYRENKGKVKISLALKNDHVSCTIEDNGIGREASREIRKNPEKNHNSLGTKITESRLKLVSTLYGTSLKTIFTDLKDDEGKGTGTRVEIQIPILT